jgi:hypothetical protein
MIGVPDDADSGSFAASFDLPGTTGHRGGLPNGPTARRIALGGALRRRREAAGLSRSQAAYEIRGSQAKISRLEAGRVGFKERDVADLLTLYGVHDPAERAEYLDLASQANSPGWWHRYSDLLESWFETYLGLEQAASAIRNYEVQFVPGLLQTEDYARAVTKLGNTDAAVIEQRVELRMRRQELLHRKNPPMLWAVVDEGALRRPLLGREQTRAQIDHLIKMNDLPHVSLQVVPFSYGGHPAAGGPFAILRFDDRELPDVVYLEQLASAHYLDKRSDVEYYLAVMDRLCTLIEPPVRTAAILEAIRADM